MFDRSRAWSLCFARNLTPCLVIALSACGKGNVGSQSHGLSSAELRTEISTLRQQISESKPDAASQHQLSRLRLRLNETLERSALSDTSVDHEEASAALSKKYELLQAILAESESSEFKPIASGDYDQPVVYHPLELAAVNKVMQTFGDLYVGPPDFVQPGEAEFHDVSVTTPWSGYWYPRRSNELFADQNSPLAKLDRILKISGYTSEAMAWEVARFGEIPPDPWEGLCGAWAVAAVLTKEPKEPFTANRELFEVKDQKALLTKIHESTPSDMYGVRYRGDFDTDGTFQDVRPEAVHRLLTVMLGTLKRAAIFDYEPGVEIWQQPVYRFMWSLKEDPQVPNSYLVQSRAFFVKHRSAQTNTPTGQSDVALTRYEYRLYVDKSQNQGGRFKVIGGEWLGDSRTNHPDFAVIPKTGAKPSSINPELQKNITVISQVIIGP